MSRRLILPRKRIYIAGPITGNKARFPFGVRYANAIRKSWQASFIEGELLKLGWAVKNPYGSAVYRRNWKIPYKLWMLQAYAHLRDIYFMREAGEIDEGAICLIPGWSTSRGACLELNYARRLELDVYEWLDRGNGNGYYIGELRAYTGGDA